MSLSDPVPLYPTYSELKDIALDNYPDLQKFLLADDEKQPWRLQHWQWGYDFLKYIGRNKSEHTYNRFRNDISDFYFGHF